MDKGLSRPETRRKPNYQEAMIINQEENETNSSSSSRGRIQDHLSGDNNLSESVPTSGKKCLVLQILVANLSRIPQIKRLFCSLLCNLWI